MQIEKAGIRNLSDQQLRKLSLQRLRSLLSTVRAEESSIYSYCGPRCCEECHEFIGDDEEWKKEVKIPAAPFAEYKERIKKAIRYHAGKAAKNLRHTIKIQKGVWKKHGSR